MLKFKSGLDFIISLLRKGFHLAALPHRPDERRTRDCQHMYGREQYLPENSCGSFSVAVGLLAAAYSFFKIYLISLNIPFWMEVLFPVMPQSCNIFPIC